MSGLGFSQEMLRLASAGYSNTFCANSHDLSLKQCIRWSRLWHEEESERIDAGRQDSDFIFDDSYKARQHSI